jgi:putative ABC transport system permease protein
MANGVCPVPIEKSIRAKFTPIGVCGCCPSGLQVVVTQTFEDSISRGLAQELLYERVLGIFAMLAVGMAVIGIYGGISYTVTQRMHELGVRMALGATPRELLRLVIGQGLPPTIAGLALGILGALVLTRLLAAVLYGVHPHDPSTFFSVAVGFATISLVAGLLPARRAARVDPIVTLGAD